MKLAILFVAASALAQPLSKNAYYVASRDETCTIVTSETATHLDCKPGNVDGVSAVSPRPLLPNAPSYTPVIP